MNRVWDSVILVNGGAMRGSRIANCWQRKVPGFSSQRWTRLLADNLNLARE